MENNIVMPSDFKDVTFDDLMLVAINLGFESLLSSDDNLVNYLHTMSIRNPRVYQLLVDCATLKNMVLSDTKFF